MLKKKKKLEGLEKSLENKNMWAQRGRVKAYAKKEQPQTETVTKKTEKAEWAGRVVKGFFGEDVGERQGEQPTKWANTWVKWLAG